MLTIDLNGIWQLQPDWQSPRLEQLPAALFQQDEWLPAHVPGTVHLDLLAAGKIPDPFYGDNERQVQWIAQIGWRYRRTLHVPAEFLEHDAVYLLAEGFDTFAWLFVNGQPVGQTCNMFVPHRFDVKSWLHAGDNEIEIVFDSPVRRARQLEAHHGMLPVALESYRVYARKAQYAYGWDWGPKLATSGIWRPLCLQAYRHLRIEDVFAEVHLDESLQRARLSVQIELERFSSVPAEFTIGVAGPKYHARQRASSSEKHLEVEFVIEQPHLWWPNGLGRQHLYEVQVNASAMGEMMEQRALRCGLRRLELLREPDAAGESFLFRINNVPIFCKGADWIPADAFLPRISDDKYRSLLGLAHGGHMNMLRVWGGGIYEDKTFYHLCDELGILVWQDFMFACGVYPDFPEFVDNVRNEVAIVVRQLRNHPCLALWCGNNENEWLWHMETQRPYHEMPGAVLFEKVIPEICAALDPIRPYWQSSPFGGQDPNDAQRGDRHQWHIWSNWADPAAVAKDRGRFISEFGFQAPAALSTWTKYLEHQDLWPQSPIFEHHNKQVEGTERLYRFLAGFVKMPDNFEDFVYKAQIVQAEALKLMVEHWRREKFHTAGALFWQLNDCWPVSSWAVIDCELQPKASYWYACRFFAPLLVSFRSAQQSLEVWVTNDTLSAREAQLEFEVLDFSGAVGFAQCQPAAIPANCSVRVATAALDTLPQMNPRQQYARARLRENGHVVAENRYFFSRFKHLALENPQLTCRLEKISKRDWQVTVKTDRFVKSLGLMSLASGSAVTQNYFDLDANGEMLTEIRNLPEKQSLNAPDLHWKWLL